MRNLEEDKRPSLARLLGEYKELFTDDPSCTTWVEHEIIIGPSSQAKHFDSSIVFGTTGKVL